MIAVDTNILVAFQRREYAHHEQAVLALTELAEGTAPWAIPWPCVHEFLAIVTNARIFKQPTSVQGAVETVDAWLESPVLRVLGEGPGYWATLRDQVLQGQIGGPRVHDARVAAICLENGARELWAADRDFSRFPKLRCRNPLVPPTQKR
ncbi:MAG: PIN domain-containing protein [Verrucomicrobiota bacterium]|nr:PIN domain-containing protein [Verrucomicrobiota bacterium]